MISDTSYTNILSNNDNINEYSVSEISAAIKGVLDLNFKQVKIRGEISGIKYASSGHVYFNLKDDNAIIAATCWKYKMSSISFKLEDGIEVICHGSVSAYAGQSKYQINVDKVENAGIGQLMKLLEERKKKLASEGLFDQQHKKAIPQYPKIIGVITSPQGAVIKDIIHRITERYPLVEVLIFPVAVQGEACSDQVTQAIKEANNNYNIDTLIIARGGGSFEDLYGFNDESIARAAFESEIPIISAIGHETDFCILDYVADARAPTPTAAAEIATPNIADLKIYIDGIYKQIIQIMYKYYANFQTMLANSASKITSPENFINNKISVLVNYELRIKNVVNENYSKFTLRLKNAESKISIVAIQNKISYLEQRLNNVYMNISNNIKNYFIKLGNFLDVYEQSILASDYQKIVDKGFVVTRDKLTNIVITSVEDLNIDKQYDIEFKDGTATVSVLGVNKNEK